ncbi:hypothetical protein B0H14DRAFT_2778631 [Mycena olivaceomarginata]|nr:hypothetical protein B0H14DRAFT_2778631 [Mycena olivaceomarginata]
MYTPLQWARGFFFFFFFFGFICFRYSFVLSSPRSRFHAFFLFVCIFYTAFLAELRSVGLAFVSYYFLPDILFRCSSFVHLSRPLYVTLTQSRHPTSATLPLAQWSSRPSTA